MEGGTRSSLLSNPLVFLAVGLIIRLVLGIAYAWVINPVIPTNLHAYNLGDTYLQYYLESVTEDWQANPNRPVADTEAYRRLGSHVDELQAFVNSTGRHSLAGPQLEAVKAMLAAAEEQELLSQGGDPGGDPPTSPLVTYGAICLFGLAIVGLVVAAGWYMSSRRTYGYGAGSSTAGGAPSGVATALAPVEWGTTTAPPVAQFTSKYRASDVGYDDSFSIDTPAGDFLGETGVGVSETIGTGDPKKITALEVWLFDKNDIRTVTKVLMSEHAFYDDALRAKLAPKGEAILARVGETVVLETASLQVSARVVELEYAASTQLPPNSYFSKVTIELAAWSKEGVPAAPAAPAAPAEPA